MLNGPKVALLNHWSSSDGDIFPYLFKLYSLGPLVGTRSWGGVRGIRGYWQMMDGGYVTIPEDAHLHARQSSGRSRTTASIPTSRSRTSRPTCWPATTRSSRRRLDDAQGDRRQAARCRRRRRCCRPIRHNGMVQPQP